MISEKNRTRFKLFCRANLEKCLEIFFRDNISFRFFTMTTLARFLVYGAANREFISLGGFLAHKLINLKC
ncbi:MAG: hypothetical protein QXO70_05205 [Candidatus Pacearchaeota archaeon]